jgi:hypothetical protein
MAAHPRQVSTGSVADLCGYLLAPPGLKRLREWPDPRRHKGVVMVGLKSVVVKSYSGTEGDGLAHGVDDAPVQRFDPTVPLAQPNPPDRRGPIVDVSALSDLRNPSRISPFGCVDASPEKAL